MKNPFALFGLPVDFSVDQNLLSERYLTLQKSLHPDNFANHSSQEQRLAMQKSSEINDALQILKDPIARADSIIALHLDSQQDAEQTTQHDVDFLMQQMAWREKLEEIEQQNALDELMVFSQNVEAYDRDIMLQLSQALSSKNWHNAQQLTNKLRFVKKLLSEIERIEEQLTDF